MPASSKEVKIKTMKPVVMPKLGLTMTEGTIATWLKQEGDTVAVGEAIAEIETEKITYSLEAPVEGTLLKIVLPAGESAPVAETIAWIGRPGEEVPNEKEGPAASLPHPSEDEASDVQPVMASPAQPALATPFAKKIARDKGVELDRVTGTGPYGRIQADDVVEFLKRLESTSHVARITPAAAVVVEQHGLGAENLRTLDGERVRRADVEGYVEQVNDVRSRVIPHSSMRQAIAKRMTESWTAIPHVTLHRSVYAEGLFELRKKASEKTTKKISMTAVIACLVSRLLPKHPLLNAHYERDGTRVFDDVHLGLAVAVSNGLVVPVIRHANSKSIPELAEEIADVSERARTGSLNPDELEGGTFTISNLGMFGVDGFTPIIVPPQTGILGIGRSVQSMTSSDGTAQNISMTLSLSFDHRAMDGVYGAQFLDSLARCIEDPMQLLF